MVGLLFGVVEEHRKSDLPGWLYIFGGIELMETCDLTGS